MDYTPLTLIPGCLLCCLLFRTSSHWPWDPLILSQTLQPLFPVSSNLLLLLDHFPFHCNTPWPHYKLDNRSQWPENGILGFQILTDLDGLHQSTGKWSSSFKADCLWSPRRYLPSKSSNTTNAPPQPPAPPHLPTLSSPATSSTSAVNPLTHCPSSRREAIASHRRAPQAALPRSSTDRIYPPKEVVGGTSLFTGKKNSLVLK